MGKRSIPNLDRLNYIRRLRDEGHTLAEIAEQVGVSRQAVHNALRRQHKYTESTICSVCGVTPVLAAGTDCLRKVACRKCLDTSASISLPLRLTSLRILAGLSQINLAKATGFSQPLISILEAGSHEPRPETWQRLFKFLNLALAKHSDRVIGSSNQRGSFPSSKPNQ
jgi:transcriptional regulator with XRE-family HTH domain